MSSGLLLSISISSSAFSGPITLVRASSSILFLMLENIELVEDMFVLLDLGEVSAHSPFTAHHAAHSLPRD